MNEFGATSRWSAVAVCAFMLAACSNQTESQPGVAAGSEKPSSPVTSEVSTHLVVGRVPVTNAGTPMVVILEPREPRAFAAQTEMPVMDQQNLTFIPAVLLVRTGQPAEFRNSDEELHNLNVKDPVTRQQAFNVAIPTAATYVHALERDGVYDVRCDIHPGMSAQIFSVSTPYATVADGEGYFSFSDVSPGRYTAKLFAGAQQLERQIDVTAARTELDFSSQ